MSTSVLKKPEVVGIALALLVTNLFTVLYFFLTEGDHFYSEEGWLENFQAVLLGLATVLFLCQFLIRPDRREIIAAGLALLCFSGLLRELDIENYQLPEVLIILGSGIGKRVMLGALWLLLIGWGLLKWNTSWSAFLRHLKAPSGRFVAAMAAFLVVAALFDKELIVVANYVFFEEFFEMNAFLMLVFAGIVYRRVGQKNRAQN